ncbi:MAG: potassium channel family protein [Thermodesulfobacteriota bacterium]
MFKTEKSGLLWLILGSTKYKMFNFMTSIFILLIISSLLHDTDYGFIFMNIASSIVFVLGIYAAGRNKRNVIILIVLGLPWFLSEWIYTRSSETIFVSILFFLFIIGTMIDHILHTKKVSADTLYAAVCVFLLLGLLWASIYNYLEYISPGIIFLTNNTDVVNTLTSNEYIYYSYTTLTTLGYGDITSLSPLGRMISVLEAITGQLFLAFLVARLVAIYTANAMRDQS